jgi:glycogen operon protein
MRRARRKADGSIEAVTMLMNASHEALAFTFPPPLLDRRMVIDSAQPRAPEREVGDTITVEAGAAMIVVGTDPGE